MERLKIIAVAAVFGLLAGVSGGVAALGWFFPYSVDNGSWYFTRSTVLPKQDQQLTDRAESKVSGKIYGIYDKIGSVGSVKYFSPEDKISDGVLAVTSGWLVAYVPNFSGTTDSWTIVSENGALYAASKSLYDKRTGLIFLKLVSSAKNPRSDEQFKVANFNTTFGQYDNVFVYDSRWENTALDGDPVSPVASHLDSVPPLAFTLTNDYKTGSVVADSDGNIVGFVAEGKMVFPLINIDNFLKNIDTKKQITYPSLGLEGWYSSEKMVILNEEKISGFVITKIDGNKQFFQKGDVLLEVNGRPVDWSALNSVLSSGVVRVNVWRGGKTVSGEVPVLNI